MQRVPASSGPEVILEVFKEDGIVVIEDFLSADQIGRFMKEVGPALEKLATGLSHGVSEQDDAMNELAGKMTKRFGQLVTASSVFRHELLEHDLMHSLLDKIFVEGPMDGYWMNASEVIEILPGSEAQPVHRDQELYPSWNRAGLAMPEAICTFISALTPFTPQNGATRVAMGTHREKSTDNVLDTGLTDRSEIQTIPAVMSAGDCILFSGKLLHGGGANYTHDEQRRGLAMSFVRTMLTPEQAHSLSIPRELAETMGYRGQAMIGFRSKWPKSTGVHNFYWSYQGAEVGGRIGLANKMEDSA